MGLSVLGKSPGDAVHKLSLRRRQLIIERETVSQARRCASAVAYPRWRNFRTWGRFGSRSHLGSCGRIILSKPKSPKPRHSPSRLLHFQIPSQKGRANFRHSVHLQSTENDTWPRFPQILMYQDTFFCITSFKFLDHNENLETLASVSRLYLCIVHCTHISVLLALCQSSSIHTLSHASSCSALCFSIRQLSNELARA